jgi:CheY-like chemotaxis protein
MVELLSDDQTLTPEQRDYVNSVQLSAKALLTIVNDILDFSKIESGRLDIEEVPFNISSIVDELVKLLSMFTNQKGLKFIYQNALDARLEVLGDPGRTRQVLSNLLTNALKFTKEGTVKLSVSATSKDSPQAGIDLLEVQFVIEDTGIGIEKHVLDKLFRPFSQGDSSTARLYGGTGLGLTISKNVSYHSFPLPYCPLKSKGILTRYQLASLMTGSITLDSIPGFGSKAIFTVPFKVSSWCCGPHLATPSPPHLESSTDSNGAPLWIQPLHRSMSEDLLNQQISNSVTNYTPPPLQSSSRHGSIDKAANTGLTPEQRSKIHVLVVEDKSVPPPIPPFNRYEIQYTDEILSAINQTIALKNIHKLGFPVTAVWNGCEALSYLLSPSASTPRPSIILMDVQMPVMDGYEATRILRTGDEYSRGELDPQLVENEISGSSIAKGLELRGKGPLRDIPVIAMTASAIQGDKEKCHEAGMDDYLAKPVEKARLEEMLLKWARRKRG